MRKVLLNIQIGDSIRQVTCQYDTQFDIYELEEDIVVNDWKIKGFVKHEKKSGYDSCFEFVISDRLDRERSKTYYYTGRAVYHPNECGLKGSSDLTPPKESYRITSIIVLFLAVKIGMNMSHI